MISRAAVYSEYCKPLAREPVVCDVAVPPTPEINSEQFTGGVLDLLLFGEHHPEVPDVVTLHVGHHLLLM